MIIGTGTSDPFFSALTDYLNTNEYSNGDTNVLWESMGESSNQPVLQWMQRWTNQQGFPLLNVARSSDGSKLLLSQQEMSQGMREGPQGLQCGVDLQTPVALPGGTSPDSSSGTSSDDGLVGLGTVPAHYRFSVSEFPGLVGAFTGAPSITCSSMLSPILGLRVMTGSLV